MKNESKSSVKAQIANIVANGDRSSKFDGEELERLVSKLQFWGANCYEPRGIGDAGLSDETLCAICMFKLPFHFSGLLVSYLDR